MERKKFYINLGSKEISQIKYDNNDEFTIYATTDEVQTLRYKLDNMNDADTRAFYRAHVPIMPYHNDESNDDYDNQITEAFRMVYELGDSVTKQHIESMGILSDHHM
ncbi:hydrolase [Lentibacillus cibarius]|uniref:Hydrolase n=1 Tax=Lentibacillus cibarius TaxID=2583219 RepID=A0A5S3QH56_9BACI|nr:hydrolase [Lentibacillus cibarius]TMN21232.1 hydrolase [Lentibacillus cibarius]